MFYLMALLLLGVVLWALRWAEKRPSARSMGRIALRLMRPKIQLTYQKYKMILII